MGKQWKRLHLMVMILSLCVSVLPVGATATAPDDSSKSTSDVIFEMINLAIEHDPAIIAQRNVIDTARRLGTFKTGPDEVIPEYARNRIAEAELERAISIQKAQEAYTVLKRQLISDLLRRITEICSLENKIENQTKLHSLLQQRQNEIERQVQAGILEPDTLWQLSESMIAVRTAIADARDQLVILKRETAFNYGGEEWRAFLGLLDELDVSP